MGYRDLQVCRSWVERAYCAVCAVRKRAMVHYDVSTTTLTFLGFMMRDCTVWKPPSLAFFTSAAAGRQQLKFGQVLFGGLPTCMALRVGLVWQT